ncbi:hypothetical protein FAM09_17725 [Niastella caeni]|uniref:Uncharacterized protein n=1 Tax=Niastella caeni TaxID=2569763 RepID=A0A4S8HZ15_9BACT|nr:hypothetical protein [Niastella caeni]THU38502.1 hypothetical protein FAM09_17725 [Niastella caeni]
MAQLFGELLFTGSLQNLSAYKMRGSDKIILRKKGGPTKKQIKHSPRFDLTRRNNNEFGGRAKAAAQIKRILHPLMFLADYNITGPLNALLKPIQKMDTQNEPGKRNILLSQHSRLLEGFTLNRRYLFESIVRTPVSCTIQKEKVIVDLPALLPGLNFMVPGNYSWFQFIAVAGLVSDLYSAHGYKPKGEREYISEYAESEWLPVNTPTAAGKLIVKGLPAQKPATCSIMVAIGIAFGTLRGDHIEPVKYVGGAKVVAME